MTVRNESPTAESTVVMVGRCPDCGSADDLATLETVLGTCGVGITLNNGTPDENFCGETKMFWDCSTSIGIQCECGWDYNGTDYLNKLNYTIQAPPQEEQDDGALR